MMKRLACAVMLGGIAAGAWLAPSLRAQGEGAPPKEKGGHMAFGKRDHEMSAEKLKEKLGLSDEQVGKLKDARKAHEEAVKPLREQMKKGMEKLRDQVKNKAADGDIQATLDELAQGRKSMQGAQEKFQADLKSILSPTQRAKMLLGAMRRMRQGEWKGKGEKHKLGRKSEDQRPTPEDEGGEPAP